MTNDVVLTHSQGDDHWILLTWAQTNEASLAPGKTYAFRLPIEMPPTAPTTPVPPSDGPQPDIHTTSISTKSSVTLYPKLLRSKPTRFEAISNVAFSLDGKTLAAMPPEEKAQSVPCKIPITTLTPKQTYIDARCSQLESHSNTDLSELVKVDPGLVGIYVIDIANLPSPGLIPATLPVLDIFGNTPKFDPKTRFVRQNACATKEACNLYLNVNYAAGVGALPAWILDGKFSPTLTSRKQFFLSPLLAADIGNNTIKGQTYTNTIDIGGTAQRVFLPGPVLQALVVTLGTTYETDRQFDRDNLLATGDSQFFFAHLYKTQQQKALEQYNDKAAKIPSLQLSDIRLPFMGYQLDFHAGTEVGGALTDTTVHASTGGATETLPQYPIFRLVPQAHFLLQLYKFSFDELFTGRYLVPSENTIVETPTHTLFLKTEQGWKGISVLTGSFALDPQGNFNINVTFKDGFAPPNYNRVNAVQAGLLIKY